MDDRLDIIIFGATGFTGKRTLPYIYKLCEELGKNFKWGVAGRSEQKLKKVLQETETEIGVSDVAIILADLNNLESIIQMTSRSKTIINCCGPYAKYGDIVIKSCLETNTHYVDISGEFYYQETIEVKYQQAAEMKGIYIISACGMDSVSSELGIYALNAAFEGTLNSVEVYLYLNINKTDNGPVLHYGTWESAVNEMGNLKNLVNLRQCRNLTPLPKLYPHLWLRVPFSKAKDIDKPDKYIVPFPSPDSFVAERTQRYLYENEKRRPVQIKFYALLSTFMFSLLALIVGIIDMILCQFQWGRNLLLKYPDFFTNGYFSSSSPSEECINNTILDIYLYGKGWTPEIVEDKQQSIPPNTSIRAHLQIPNPFYGFACLTLALSAFTILTEKSKMPSKGGVYTPTAAFLNTSYMQEIQKRGYPVKIIEVKDI